MATRAVTIASPVGLHARPAAIFAAAATDTGLDVMIGRPGEEPVEAGSILALMALGIKHGEEVVLSAHGDGAETSVGTLADLLATDLDAH